MKTIEALAVLLLFISLIALSGCQEETTADPSSEEYDALPYPDDIVDDPGYIPDEPIEDDPVGEIIETEDQNTTTGTTATDTCAELTITAKADTCYLELATRNRDADTCRKLKVISKERCYKEVAIAANDKELCDVIIKDKTIANECYSQLGMALNDTNSCIRISNDSELLTTCLMNVAEDAGDPKACIYISNSTTRDECYTTTSLKSGNMELCEKISTKKNDEDAYYRDLCYDQVESLSGELCFNYLDEEKKANCFEYAKKDAGEEAICTELVDTNSLNNCKFWKATSLNDKELCNELPKWQKQECETTIASNLGESECTAISNYVERNTCYYDSALVNKDINLCLEISGETLRKDTCLKETAFAAEDDEGCGKISVNNKSLKDACYTEIAIQLQDATICEGTTLDKSYYKCFAEVALLYNAPEICNTAERDRLVLLAQYPGNYCIMEYALQKEDKSICAMIELSSLKSECELNIDRKGVCVHNDDECDEDLCTFSIDNDCPAE